MQPELPSVSISSIRCLRCSLHSIFDSGEKIRNALPLEPQRVLKSRPFSPFRKWVQKHSYWRGIADLSDRFATMTTARGFSRPTVFQRTIFSIVTSTRIFRIAHCGFQRKLEKATLARMDWVKIMPRMGTRMQKSVVISNGFWLINHERMINGTERGEMCSFFLLSKPLKASAGTEEKTVKGFVYHHEPLLCA